MSDGPLEKRCGTCARFVRVTESIDQNGEVRRGGECLLGVWPPPIYQENTCSQHVRRGEVKALVRTTPRRTRQEPRRGFHEAPRGATLVQIPEEILDMDADEFRTVLREVIRDELGIGEVTLGGRWEGGEVVVKPGKEGVAEKRIPVEALFHKIVMVRDKLRVLEQKINAHAQLTAEDKVQMQQYVTQCYGSLTTFNFLFADKGDAFVGQKGERD